MSARELCFFVPSEYGAHKGPWWGLNEILSSARRSRTHSDRAKQGAERHVAAIAAAAMQDQGWTAPNGKCEVVLTFVEKNRSRDPDNIYGGAKYILDALCEPTFMRVDKRTKKEVWKHKNGCAAIIDDSQRYVELRCAIAERCDPKAPGVWVRIREKERNG